ncbi:MAG: SUF system NifU family Fe-S cluster assembly protein [Wenzhouxiangellaceae bacterium]|jgi:nitrogen fixation NifU-like protein|nr:SUF system NifU family Fe-S cluster assembly protein [Wenzhouxiangellaceae bacterium]MBS3746356.1 SUF system NifU family Fe-S cluster assembly protein [Wenzhouxiangellaceae bacterium]MBS3823721.1 SUF system NifU family Fe-S cluster assembly protein [Wenzhouxiangellaceae bacterium]
MSLDQLYQSKILEHNRAPHNHFEMPDATHSARGLDALCGDDIRVWIRVEDGRVASASWSGDACAITTASASMLTDWLAGRRVDEIEPAARRFEALLDDDSAPDAIALGDINALRAVGRFPSRRRNALLPWIAALNAL